MKIPSKVVAKADVVRKRIAAGEIHPRKMRERGFYSVEVGRRYRLTAGRLSNS